MLNTLDDLRRDAHSANSANNELQILKEAYIQAMERVDGKSQGLQQLARWTLL